MLRADPDRAMEWFKGGIALIRSTLNDEDLPPQPEMMNCVEDTFQGHKIVESISFCENSPGVHGNDSVHVKISPTNGSSSDINEAKAPSESIYDANDGFVSLFHRALIICESAVAEISEMGDPCSFLSAVVLFNIGLNHHRTGLQSANQSFRLGKALTLYRMARSILEQSPDRTMGTKFGLLVYLASCNNMAHIFSELCAFDELKYTWKSLLDMCVACHHVMDQELHPDEQELFMLNAFLFADGANIAPAA